jgi:RuvB-like protein 1 (pontin 52)
MKIETLATSSSATLSSSVRVSAHTHITGLGLDDNGDAIVASSSDAANTTTSGLIGQVAAREALGVVADLIHSQRLAGRALLLVGPPGTGKVSGMTAAAAAVTVSAGKFVLAECVMCVVWTRR